MDVVQYTWPAFRGTGERINNQKLKGTLSEDASLPKNAENEMQKMKLFPYADMFLA